MLNYREECFSELTSEKKTGSSYRMIYSYHYVGAQFWDVGNYNVFADWLTQVYLSWNPCIQILTNDSPSVFYITDTLYFLLKGRYDTKQFLRNNLRQCISKVSVKSQRVESLQVFISTKYNTGLFHRWAPALWMKVCRSENSSGAVFGWTGNQRVQVLRRELMYAPSRGVNLTTGHSGVLGVAGYLE